MNERDEIERQLRACKPCPKCGVAVHPRNVGFHICEPYGDHNSRIDAALAADQPAGSLLRQPSAHAPPGCHCTTYCAAPVIMGRQQPCRDPEKRASFQTAEGK